MNNTDRELAEAELEHVAGGKPSAAPKQDPLPKEQVTLEYGGFQITYTQQAANG
jgi:hypothetical protein